MVLALSILVGEINKFFGGIFMSIAREIFYSYCDQNTLEGLHEQCEKVSCVIKEDEDGVTYFFDDGSELYHRLDDGIEFTD
jgi:hypothetical protein